MEILEILLNGRREAFRIVYRCAEPKINEKNIEDGTIVLVAAVINGV